MTGQDRTVPPFPLSDEPVHFVACGQQFAEQWLAHSHMEGCDDCRRVCDSIDQSLRWLASLGSAGVPVNSSDEAVGVPDDELEAVAQAAFGAARAGGGVSEMAATLLPELQLLVARVHAEGVAERDKLERQLAAAQREARDVFAELRVITAERDAALALTASRIAEAVVQERQRLHDELGQLALPMTFTIASDHQVRAVSWSHVLSVLAPTEPVKCWCNGNLRAHYIPTDSVSAAGSVPVATPPTRCGDVSATEGWAPCDRKAGHSGPHTWPLIPPTAPVATPVKPAEQHHAWYGQSCNVAGCDYDCCVGAQSTADPAPATEPTDARTPHVAGCGRPGQCLNLTCRCWCHYDSALSDALAAKPSVGTGTPAETVESMCHWTQGRGNARDESHEEFHYGSPCPYESMAAVLRGEPDPRDADCDHGGSPGVTSCRYCVPSDPVEELREQRDAYADTLANIAESGDPEDVPAALIARMTLDQQGYLPFGRLRRTEAERDATVARAVHLTAEVARYRAAAEQIKPIVLRFGREYHADDPGAMAQDICDHVADALGDGEAMKCEHGLTYPHLHNAPRPGGFDTEQCPGPTFGDGE